MHLVAQARSPLTSPAVTDTPLLRVTIISQHQAFEHFLFLFLLAPMMGRTALLVKAGRASFSIVYKIPASGKLGLVRCKTPELSVFCRRSHCFVA